MCLFSLGRNTLCGWRTFLSLLVPPSLFSLCPLTGLWVPARRAFQRLHSFPWEAWFDGGALAVVLPFVPSCSASPAKSCCTCLSLCHSSTVQSCPPRERTEKCFFQFKAERFLFVAVSGSISGGQRKAEEHLADNWAGVHQKVSMWSLLDCPLVKHLCK